MAKLGRYSSDRKKVQTLTTTGTEIQEIDSDLLEKLKDLLETEINLRELGMDMPVDETVH